MYVFFRIKCFHKYTYIGLILKKKSESLQKLHDGCHFQDRVGLHETQVLLFALIATFYRWIDIFKTF